MTSLKQELLEILKLWKLTDTYGINPDLPLEAILQTIRKHLPEKLDMLDVGELGGADGCSGFSSTALAYKTAYNQAIKDMESNLQDK